MSNRHLTQRVFLSVGLLAASATRADETNRWSLDVSLYGLAVGMSGDIGIGRLNADIDVGFDKIWDKLEFGGMGTLRLGYGPWALTTDIIYMGLQGSKRSVSAELDQWMVEPTLSYRVSRFFEPLAGVRYNNLNGGIYGPGFLTWPRIPTGTQAWWDPIMGANASLPLGHRFSLNFRGDIGGFGAGSDLTWQAFSHRVGSSPSGDRSNSAIAGSIWTMKPGAARTGLPTKCSVKARNLGSRCTFESGIRPETLK